MTTITIPEIVTGDVAQAIFDLAHAECRAIANDNLAAADTTSLFAGSATANDPAKLARAQALFAIYAQMTGWDGWETEGARVANTVAEYEADITEAQTRYAAAEEDAETARGTDGHEDAILARNLARDRLERLTTNR